MSLKRCKIGREDICGYLSPDSFDSFYSFDFTSSEFLPGGSAGPYHCLPLFRFPTNLTWNLHQVSTEFFHILSYNETREIGIGDNLHSFLWKIGK